LHKFYNWLIVVSVFALLGCEVSGQKETQSNSTDLVINAMTFNIRNGLAKDGENSWKQRSHLVTQIIDDNHADVVGLQEAFRFQLNDITNALPIYSYVGLGRDGNVNDEYSAILYRTDRFVLDEKEFGTFWLSDTPELPSKNWGNNYLRICTWARLIDKSTGQAFYIYNTHLDHRSQISREKSVRLIANVAQTRSYQDPFVLMGDFNAGEDNPSIEYILGKNGSDSSPIPMVDSYRNIHPKEEVVGTFNGFKGDEDGAKIDYIFVEPEAEIIDAKIIRTNTKGRYPSDHFPVTALIQFDKEK
jgi:endonuclease/exonuclease/phosphatase family metal-dependent hydrolase